MTKEKLQQYQIDLVTIKGKIEEIGYHLNMDGDSGFQTLMEAYKFFHGKANQELTNRIYAKPEN